MRYANGREARVGDPVIGYTHASNDIQVGLLMSITSGGEICNAMVGTLKRQLPENLSVHARPVAPLRSEGAGYDGELGVAVYVCVLADLRKMLHAEDMADWGDAREMLADQLPPQSDHRPIEFMDRPYALPRRSVGGIDLDSERRTDEDVRNPKPTDRGGSRLPTEARTGKGLAT